MVKLTKQIGVRLLEQTYSLLKEIVKFRGEDLSDFVRRAIYKELAALSFLSNSQKKALGIYENEKTRVSDFGENQQPFDFERDEL